MSKDCCHTTQDGTTFWAMPASGEEAGCSCASQPATPLLMKTTPGLWLKIRGGVLFGVACLTSPCCTPLYVPLVLVLLAGTPVAAWLTHYLGWVYGGLTLVSVISLVLGWRWLGQGTTSQPRSQPISREQATDIPRLIQPENS